MLSRNNLKLQAQLLKLSRSTLNIKKGRAKLARPFFTSTYYRSDSRDERLELELPVKPNKLDKTEFELLLEFVLFRADNALLYKSEL